MGILSGVDPAVAGAMDKTLVRRLLENADERGIAKVANLASQSISSQSQSLGSGTASQPLSF